MEDAAIIDLYWQRDEAAIAETNRKYGRFCHSIALNILSVHEDAEECVNDTWHRTWNAIPPQRPNALRAWLGKIVRNLSLDRWRKNRAQKRGCGLEQLLTELEDCVPVAESPESLIETTELSHYISGWLDTLPSADRALFIRRYWYGEGLDRLAAESGMPPGRLAQKMFRLRNNLKLTLEREGVTI